MKALDATIQGTARAACGSAGMSLNAWIAQQLEEATRA
jgi:predicted HicB family RNase H-like nuclease